MPETPDYTAAGEIYRKSMEEAMARIDQLSEELRQAHEKAVDQEFAAAQELKRIQREAEQLSREYIDQHRKEYNAGIRKDVLMEVTKKLMQAGRSSAELKHWLEIDPKMIADAWLELGFEVLGDRAANVTFESQGRTGYVYFNWDGLLLRFPYELGGGKSLANIEIPAADTWEATTGIKPEHRRMILEFVAGRAVRDQAEGHQYEITADYIHIYR